MDTEFALSVINKTKKDYNDIEIEFRQTRKHVTKDMLFVANKCAGVKSILDIGCGSGRFLAALVAENKLNQNGIKYYLGVDQSNKLIAGCNQDFKEQINEGVAEFKVEGFLDFEPEQNKPDIITAFASFHHIPGFEFRQESLTRIFGALPKNGKLIMFNWNLLNETFVARYKLDFSKILDGYDKYDTLIPWKKTGNKIFSRYYHAFTENELENLADASGFKIIEQYYILKGEKSNIKEGENIFSLWTKK